MSMSQVNAYAASKPKPLLFTFKNNHANPQNGSGLQEVKKGLQVSPPPPMSKVETTIHIKMPQL